MAEYTTSDRLRLWYIWTALTNEERQQIYALGNRVGGFYIPMTSPEVARYYSFILGLDLHLGDEYYFPSVAPRGSILPRGQLVRRAHYHFNPLYGELDETQYVGR